MWLLPLRLRSALLLVMWLLCMWLLCMRLLCRSLLQLRLRLGMLSPLLLVQQLLLILPLILLSCTEVILMGEPCRLLPIKWGPCRLLPINWGPYRLLPIKWGPCRLLPIKWGLQQWVLLLSIHCCQFSGCGCTVRVSVGVWKGVRLGLSRSCRWRGGRGQGGLASRGAGG